jgi:F0F1-type ATP synthase membrane subunit c/vacuolar-type H+-ATPase subunit K
MAHALSRLALAAAVVAALGGCTVMAVGGAVVGAGVAVASTAVGAGVAVGKGVVHVAGAPFRDDEDEDKDD